MVGRNSGPLALPFLLGDSKTGKVAHGNGISYRYLLELVLYKSVY